MGRRRTVRWRCGVTPPVCGRRRRRRCRRGRAIPRSSPPSGRWGRPSPRHDAFYYRGLDRDTGLNGPARTSSAPRPGRGLAGASVVDHQALGGEVREEIVYDGANEISKSISTSTVWQTAGGALPTWQTPPERISYLARTTSAKALTKVSDGTWRTNETTALSTPPSARCPQVDDQGPDKSGVVH